MILCILFLTKRNAPYIMIVDKNDLFTDECCGSIETLYREGVIVDCTKRPTVFFFGEKRKSAPPEPRMTEEQLARCIKDTDEYVNVKQKKSIGREDMPLNALEQL